MLGDSESTIRDEFEEVWARPSRVVPMNVSRLEDRYGGFFRGRPKLQLSPGKVPLDLRPYIDWAAYWGVSDDIDREVLLKDAPEEALKDLRNVVDQIHDDLNEWLAGPAANAEPPSAEYIAFSAMRLAAI